MRVEYIFSIILITLTVVNAGQTQCPEASVSLYGKSTVLMGGTYEGRLDLHKVSAGAGYNGRWKIDRLHMINTYPHQVRPMHMNQKVEFKKNTWMQCDYTMGGNQIVTDCTGGNYLLDVYNNKIGLFETNIWIGSIQGKHVSLKFDKSNPWEPVLTGTINELPGGKMDVNILTPENKHKLVFTQSNPGTLELELQAKASPSEYENDIVWEIPDIGNAQKTITPPDARGANVKVLYTGLPKHNMDFGEKQVKASLTNGTCRTSDTKTIYVFFPRDAKNNPDPTTPNWFYYWSQTPAKKGPAKFGDPANQCQTSGSRADNILGYYRNKILDSVYYICDLKTLGDEFPFKTVQTQGDELVNASVKGIDTFAAACWHENAHYRHFSEWWFPHRTNNPSEDFDRNGIKDSVETQLDTDKDMIPDSKEPAMHLNPQTKYTYPGPYDDEEVASWFEESNWQIGSADKEDWAKPGKQWAQ